MLARGQWLQNSVLDHSWIEGVRKLSDHVINELSHLEHAKLVKDYSSNGEQNIRMLQHLLPHEIIQKILRVHLPSSSNNEDLYIWKLTPSGTFSLRTMNNFLVGLEADVADQIEAFNWTAIWNWNSPPRMRTFLWLVAYRKILTNSQRVKCHIASSDTSLCNNHVETILQSGLSQSNKHLEPFDSFTSQEWFLCR